jgi:septum formation protein
MKPPERRAPLALATRLAAAKAADVAARHPGAWVIGSDQVADLNGQPLGKPGTVEAACAQLAAMSGQTVRFHTAISLRRDGESLAALDLTEVRFRALDPQEIAATSPPSSRWTAPAASSARAWASACSRQSTTATRPRWSACH